MIQPPRATVKTAWVSAYMVEEKGVKTERTEHPSDEYDCTRRETWEASLPSCWRMKVRRKGTGGCLRRTISPVCGGPWRVRGTPRGAGCCCLLRLNSSYTLDTCHAVSTEKKSTQQMMLALGCLEKTFFPILPFYTLPSSLYFYICRRSSTQLDDYLIHLPIM